nr:STI1-like protein [Ipomoea batatas]GMD20848.1 STI1-like protein [Ipomoea batatas]
MAVAMGNIAVLLDGSHVTLPRAVPPQDRKIRAPPNDVVFNLFAKRETPHGHASLAATGFEYDKDSRNPKVKAKSKAGAVDYENSSDDENGGNGNGFDEEEEEGREEKAGWEREMRRRVKEIEEMKELEKKAEELQNRVDEEYDEGSEKKQETEEEKREKVRKELEKVAKEQAERRRTAQLMFDLGQKAYGKGSYGRAIEFLEGALTIIPRPTLFGGEIQIWLAMAYEANNRHTDCISLYKKLEKFHPSISIRRQAKELRYILQAPKLKISQEEMVTIPLIGSSYDSYAATWTDKNKDKEQMQSGITTKQVPSSRDWLGDFLVWKPPVGLEKSQTFWVALTLWIGLVGAAIFLQR